MADASVMPECDPCQFEGTISKSVGFCKLCQEYLCSICMSVHQKSKATRGHRVTYAHNSPTKSNPIAISICDLHGQNVSRYCKTHDVSICEISQAIDHRTCEIVNIADICKTEATTELALSFLGDIRSSIERLNTLEKEEIQNTSKLIEQKENCIQQIENIRQLINVLLDKLDGEIRHELDDIIQESEELSSKLKNTVRLTIMALEHGYAEIEHSCEVSEEQTFVAMKKVTLTKAAAVIKDIKQERARVMVTFKPHEMLSYLLNDLKSLGKLEVETKLKGIGPADAQPNNYAAPLAKITIEPTPRNSPAWNGHSIPKQLRDCDVTKKGQYNVKEADDSSPCHITGIQTLPNDDLLVCDFNNRKVKLLDNTCSVIKSSLKMSGQPWDIAIISEQEAVFTVPHNRILKFVTLKENGKSKLQEARKVNTDRKCWGISHSKEQLFVCCHGQPGTSEVIIVSIQGQLLSRVPRTDHFLSPYYLAVDNAGGMIYISDSGSNTLTCMTTSGHIVFTCGKADTGLSDPRGILVDSIHNLYVCGAASNNIQILDAEGKLYKTLVKEGSGTIGPKVLAYRSHDQTLLIGMGGNHIHCFNFAKEAIPVESVEKQESTMSAPS